MKTSEVIPFDSVAIQHGNMLALWRGPTHWAIYRPEPLTEGPKWVFQRNITAPLRITPTELAREVKRQTPTKGRRTA